jgi:hypothetical protein
MVNLATTIQPTAFVQHRLNELANEAKISQQATDGSKTISLSAVLFCLCNIANPVALALLYVAGLNYAVCVAVDAYRTRGLYLLPIWRKSAMEMLDTDSDNDDRHLYQLTYLRPEQEYEHWLLTTFPQQVIQMLAATPMCDRAVVYEHILASRHNAENNPLKFKQETITAPQQPTQTPCNQTPATLPQTQAPTPEPSPWDTVNTDDIITIPTGMETANGGRAIDLLLDNPLLTRAIIAGQRTGKTHLASIATWSIQRQHSVKVHYLNLYDHGQGNNAAFSHANNGLTFNWPSLNEQQRIKVAKAAIKLIEYFIQGPSGQILVIDEWMSLGAKLPKFNTEIPESVILMNEFWRKLFEQLTQINSVGIATGKAIYAIMPYFQAGALRDEAKAIKNASPIILAVRPRHFIEWQDPITKNIAKIGYDPKITSDVAFNWRLPITNPTTAQVIQWESNGDERIYYAGGEWNAIGKMPCKPTTSV